MSDFIGELANAGLTEGILCESARSAFCASSNSDSLHPRTHAGYQRYAAGLHALRERLTPLGWIAAHNQLESVVSPCGRHRIVVASGDAATGVPYQSPSTKYPRGPQGRGAVMLNQLALFPEFFESGEGEGSSERLFTWHFLLYAQREYRRAELSLPSSQVSGAIQTWQERWLLPSSQVAA